CIQQYLTSPMDVHGINFLMYQVDRRIKEKSNGPYDPRLSRESKNHSSLT
uniref:Uncharacterized protein n=1 Tax=Ditylenchus dipsaci TaxID=166011 RepID=A0A915DIX2_9BILA